MHNPPHPMSVLRRYRKERGGKIQWIICPTAPVEPDMAKYREQVEELVKDGCEAIYLWGVHADSLVAQGKIDLIAKAVELPKEFGVPSGVGCHSLDVVKACEKNGVQGRLLHQDLPPPQLPDRARSRSSSTSPTTSSPATGARNPRGDRRVHEDRREAVDRLQDHGRRRDPAARTPSATPSSNGADFVLAGMFDFEIAEDVKLATEALRRTQGPRPAVERLNRRLPLVQLILTSRLSDYWASPCS